MNQNKIEVEIMARMNEPISRPVPSKEGPKSSASAPVHVIGGVRVGGRESTEQILCTVFIVLRVVELKGKGEKSIQKRFTQVDLNAPK